MYFGNDIFIIIASSAHGHEMYRQLLFELITKRKNIFLPTHGTIMATVGTQYFDSDKINLEPGEVFVDVGMYDGGTSQYVMDNCDYKKIIGFEASEIMARNCRDKFKRYSHRM